LGAPHALAGEVVAVVNRVAGVVVALLAVTACAPKVRRHPVVSAVPRSTEWPRPEVMDLATRAWRCGQASGEFSSPMLTVIDYSLPSTERRLWVIDMMQRRVLQHELVAHGEGSGGNNAVAFSNLEGSNQSSLGLFRTEDTYQGGNGYSLRITGLEPGVNDRAMERKIVVHGADYVSPDVIPELGRLGRSHGCPALQRSVARSIIDTIKGGSAIFAYYPDPQWLHWSQFLRCDGVLTAQR
jgi:L,D-transpeptidase catalytic domain